MVRATPYHLLNQEITVISGGLSYDLYGEHTYSTVVVSSGSARLQFEEVRTIDSGNVVIATTAVAYVDPLLEVDPGHLAVIAGTKYRVTATRPLTDIIGRDRLKRLVLNEVEQ